MKTKTILFDLDGTLLPMDEPLFIQLYLQSITETFKDTIDPALFAKVLWEGTALMTANTSSQTNEDVFWDHMEKRLHQKLRHRKQEFTSYYQNEFEAVKPACPRDDQVQTIIRELKKDYQLILATNPVFPREAVEKRLEWAGLHPSDFYWITTYENSTRCKPDPAYFEEIIAKTGIDPASTVMIGNDVHEDFWCASQAGIPAFVLTRCLINRNHLDMKTIAHGSWEQAIQWIRDHTKTDPDTNKRPDPHS